jgi:outer membrane protein OmpA-like peptidoglycan-associated protein
MTPRPRGRFGQRGTQFPVLLGCGRARWITDYERYFLIWDEAPDPTTGNPVVSNARQAPRVNVSTRTIDGFAPGSDAVPARGVAIVAALVADLTATESQFATARIDGFTDDRESPTKSLDLARLRAERVRDAVLQVNVWGGWRRFTPVEHGATDFVAPNDHDAGRSRNRRAVITVDRPYLP